MTDPAGVSALREGEPPVDIDLGPIKAREASARQHPSMLGYVAAELLAASFQDIPALVAEVSRLRAAQQADLQAWREQDETLQAICRECGDDEHVSNPADVVALVRQAFLGLRAALAERDQSQEQALGQCRKVLALATNPHWINGRRSIIGEHAAAAIAVLQPSAAPTGKENP